MKAGFDRGSPSIAVKFSRTALHENCPEILKGSFSSRMLECTARQRQACECLTFMVSRRPQLFTQTNIMKTIVKRFGTVKSSQVKSNVASDVEFLSRCDTANHLLPLAQLFPHFVRITSPSLWCTAGVGFHWCNPPVTLCMSGGSCCETVFILMSLAQPSCHSALGMVFVAAHFFD